MAIVRTFFVGQNVTWSSIRKRQHNGVVQAVVPAGDPAIAHVPAGRWTLMFKADTVRRRQSYLVSDGNRLYRPLTQAIEAGLGFSGTVTIAGGGPIDWFGPARRGSRLRRALWAAVALTGVAAAVALVVGLGRLS